MKFLPQRLYGRLYSFFHMFLYLGPITARKEAETSDLGSIIVLCKTEYWINIYLLVNYVVVKSN